ncbi:efflux RND transporter permease subunit [Chondromyces apiculatus]|uniref:Cobalt-zinc-cadmium resistance protein CzcA/Cation efflux system protein CusA n=1 Tax=Chondromyces apiculatus DSM 436 TaxID=1192034 RepID=A0A017TEB3_9BACT|nr:efflux RND transporter permease subunit [Chondromyces apiculatus]EYF07623.1 Cobalt-zinc-cadmium resistance protein CzcA/Cation efflux system protein CusA [Chondromyces apiculatus DSM 436]
MMGWIIAWCAKHRGFVIAMFALLAIGAEAARRRLPLDAIPDLSDPQVIVFTEWMGRSPTLVEDQVTYPIASALLAAPKVTDVRGFSMQGMSFVYVLFEEGTDVYWARSRVLEYLSAIQQRLPEGVSPALGPDATGVGWVYQYAVVDRSGRKDAADLRELQDFTLRYALESVPGVAQVAAVGGFERQYQVTLDPERLRAFGVTFEEVAGAVRRSSSEVGGRVLELAGREYAVRGRGYVGSVEDLGAIVIRSSAEGSSVRVRDVGAARIGPDARRGAADLDGLGEVAGGIVVMRYGENALEVIQRVEAKLDELRRALPEGVEIVTTYDRSGLIERSVDTLKRALVEEIAVVSVVIVLFLLHFRSALLPIVSLPLAVLLAFVPMWWLGVPSTIMSLGGIAIAIGATVDAEIVMVEACHKRLEHAPKDLSPKERAKLLAKAAEEVTPAIFSSLLIIAVSFIPVFGLTGQAGRLFRPLAYTKTFVMLAAAVLSVTLAPALRDLLLRGKIRPESEHPISRAVIAVYQPFVYVALRRPITTVLIGVLAVVSAIPVGLRLGSEFMPNLNEGDLLYMPTTLPGISIEEAKRQLQRQDAILKSFPEVKTVHGKVGRAETATDPAPLSMAETVIQLHPREAWPKVPEARWYSSWAPEGARRVLGKVWPEERPETWEELVAKLNAAMQLPGFTNAWTMPIRARIDMLTTGVRTPVGVKVFGHDLHAIERVGKQVEAAVGRVAGTRSVLYERSLGGAYVDITPDRAALARYGLSVEDVQAVIEGAIGGEVVAGTVEGRGRFTVNVRYKEDFRSSPGRLREVLVPLPERAGAEAATRGGEGAGMGAPGAGAGGTAGMGMRTIPLGEVAEVAVVEGPPMIRDEAGQLVGYVYIDVDPARDIGGYVADARAAVGAAMDRGELTLEGGMYLTWTGQYELLEEMRERMSILVPLALAIVVVLLWVQFRNVTEVLIVLLSIPFALVGSVWLLYLLDYRLSTAVWVGIIALLGLAAQTGIVMIVYIDQAFFRRLRAGRIRDLNDIIWAHMEGTVMRVRPKLMTVSTMLIGLTPLLWAEGSGADVMKRIAAPMVGGLLTSAFLTLEIIPVVYTWWRYAQLKEAQRTGRPLAEVVGLREAG